MGEEKARLFFASLTLLDVGASVASGSVTICRLAEPGTRLGTGITSGRGRSR